MTILLLRHTHAGNRATWTGDDHVRPISTRGRSQATMLVEALSHLPIDRILSSPYDRCVQSVIPLAEARAVGIEPTAALAEDARKRQIRALLVENWSQNVLLCTHGDVIPVLLDEVAARGADLGPDPRWDKAGTWVIETDADLAVSARYQPPPKPQR